MNDRVRVKLRDGDRELEYEGPLEVVEAQLQGWQSWVERKSGDPLRCRPAGPAREAEGTLRDLDASCEGSMPPAREVELADVGGSLPRVAPDFKVRRNLTLEGLVALKEPQLDVERLLVIAYYGERYEERSVHRLYELEKAWMSTFPDFPWRAEVLEEAIERGFLQPTEPEGVTLSYRGESFVRDGLV
ncbi:MAG: hypothetical protein VKP72_02980 [bacterium]|nr:hypothetical protein [bacterium]